MVIISGVPIFRIFTVITLFTLAKFHFVCQIYMVNFICKTKFVYLNGKFVMDYVEKKVAMKLKADEDRKLCCKIV